MDVLGINVNFISYVCDKVIYNHRRQAVCTHNQVENKKSNKNSLKSVLSLLLHEAVKIDL